MEKIKNCFKKREYDQVLTLAQQALQKDPNNKRLLLLVGYTNQLLGRREEGISWISKAFRVEDLKDGYEYQMDQEIETLIVLENETINKEEAEETEKIDAIDIDKLTKKLEERTTREIVTTRKTHSTELSNALSEIENELDRLKGAKQYTVGQAVRSWFAFLVGLILFLDFMTATVLVVLGKFGLFGGLEGIHQIITGFHMPATLPLEVQILISLPFLCFFGTWDMMAFVVWKLSMVNPVSGWLATIAVALLGLILAIDPVMISSQYFADGKWIITLGMVKESRLQKERANRLENSEVLKYLRRENKEM